MVKGTYGIQFVGFLLALELSSGKLPRGRSHLKVRHMKADSAGVGIGSPYSELGIPPQALPSTVFSTVGIAWAGQWKLLFFTYLKFLLLMPVVCIQREVCVRARAIF